MEENGGQVDSYGQGASTYGQSEEQGAAEGWAAGGGWGQGGAEEEQQQVLKRLKETQSLNANDEQSSGVGRGRLVWSAASERRGGELESAGEIKRIWGFFKKKLLRQALNSLPRLLPLILAVAKERRLPSTPTPTSGRLLCSSRSRGTTRMRSTSQRTNRWENITNH